MFFLDDPLTRSKRIRAQRQKQAFFYGVVGLVMGSSLMNIAMELVKGLQVP